MLENYGIAILYTKAFLDMLITTKVGGFIVLCFASIHVQVWQQMKKSLNSGKFPRQLLYISLLPSYHIWILNQLDASTNSI